MKHRNDIQIFRGVAVIFVVLYHLRVGIFASGFLGVDVFFVISGFLMQRLYGDNSNPLSFYSRRARRLLPAYFATIAATLAAAYFVTLPVEYEQVVQQAEFAAAFASNIGFWMQNSYFAHTEFNPLLHLWSLGVELQFYLILPAMVALNRKFRWSTLSLTAISLVACLAAVTISPKLSFFMMPLRVWEFGLGMLVAQRPEQDGRWQWPSLLCAAGILAVPALPVDGEALSVFWGHPAGAALLVTLCTAGLLAFRLPSQMVDSWIGIALQRLGDISYSVYLAHFPVIVLYHYAPFHGTQLGDGSPGDIAVLLALIAIATCAIYFGFERPGPRFYSPRRMLLSAGSVVAAALILQALQLSRYDAGDRLIFAALRDRGPYRCGKFFRILHPSESFCPIADETGQRIMLVGDSHADAIKETFARMAQRHGLTTYFAVGNDPLLSPGLNVDWLTGQARLLGVRAVFFHYSPPNLSLATIESARAALEHLGIATILIEPVPVYADSVPQLLYRARHGREPVPVQTRQSYHAGSRDLERYLRSTPSIGVIDPSETLCTPICRLADAGGRPFYFDSGHLTLTGAEQLAGNLDAGIGRAGEGSGHPGAR